MAEGVFRHLTNHTRPNAHPLIKTIDSCGTGAYHTGEPPDPRTMSVLADHGIKASYYRHQARKFRNQDFTDFDYIFAMDDSNLSDLESTKRRLIKKGDLKEDQAAQVMLFGAWGCKGEEEVGDPYYGARDGFTIAYEQVERFSNGFIKHLEQGAAGNK